MRYLVLLFCIQLLLGALFVKCQNPVTNLPEQPQFQLPFIFDDTNELSVAFAVLFNYVALQWNNNGTWSFKLDLMTHFGYSASAEPFQIALDLFYTNPDPIPTALIVDTSLNAMQTSSVCDYVGIPVNGFMAASDALSLKELYPNFWRFNQPYTDIFTSLAVLLRAQLWNHAVIIADPIFGTLVADSFNVFQANEISTILLHINRASDAANLMSAVKGVPERIILVFTLNPDIEAAVAIQAKNAGLLGPKSPKIWLWANIATIVQLLNTGTLDLEDLGGALFYAEPKVPYMFSNPNTDPFFPLALSIVRGVYNSLDFTKPWRAGKNTTNTIGPNIFNNLPFMSTALRTLSFLCYLQDQFVTANGRIMTGAELSNAMANFNSDHLFLNERVGFDSNQDNMFAMMYIGNIHANNFDSLHTVASAWNTTAEVASYVPLVWPGNELYPDDGVTKLSNSYVGSSVGIVAIFASVLLILFIHAIGAVIIWKWGSPIVKLAAPYLMLMELLGALLVAVSLILYVQYLSPTICALQSIFFHCGYSIIFGATTAKNLRVFLIFHHLRSPTVKVISESWTILIAIGFTLPTWGLELSQAIRQTHQIIRQFSTSETSIWVFCKSTSDPLSYLSLAYLGVLLIANVALVVLTIKVPRAFNEKYLAAGDYANTVCIVLALGIPYIRNHAAYQSNYKDPFVQAPLEFKWFTVSLITVGISAKLLASFTKKAYHLLLRSKELTQDELLELDSTHAGVLPSEADLFDEMDEVEFKSRASSISFYRPSTEMGESSPYASKLALNPLPTM